MTEAEAKTKWCPFVRFSSFDASINRRLSEPHIHQCTLCIASDCMAWRWEDREDGTGYCGLIHAPN